MARQFTGFDSFDSRCVCVAFVRNTFCQGSIGHTHSTLMFDASSFRHFSFGWRLVHRPPSPVKGHLLFTFAIDFEMILSSLFAVWCRLMVDGAPWRIRLNTKRFES